MSSGETRLGRMSCLSLTVARQDRWRTLWPALVSSPPMPGAGTVRSAQLRRRCFAALSVVGALWLMASVSAAASNGSCGTARAHGGPNGQLVDVRITVLVGPASCHTARKVLA